MTNASSLEKMNEAVTLNNLLLWGQVMNSFKEVKRQLTKPFSEDRENDAEHSYDVAMTCWYLISTLNLDLDLNKVIKYSLLHDLVEIYAGDVGVFDPNYNKQEIIKKEKEALNRLNREFYNFPELIRYIIAFENRIDIESRFVKVVETTIQPLLLLIHGNNKDNKRRDVTFEQSKAYVHSKLREIEGHEIYEPVANLVNQLLEIQKKLF